MTYRQFFLGMFRQGGQLIINQTLSLVLEFIDHESHVQTQ